MIRRLEGATLRVLRFADSAFNRLYTWRYNPLYQSGTIAVAMLAVLIITGVWLLLFYRIGAPWASVDAITRNLWTGNWVRGVHRYASDAALIAAVIHLFRMFGQGRAWGPRAIAWISGGVLLAVLLVSAWTGFVMVWDTFGYQLAVAGGRMIDALPFFSEPVGRIFVGERPVPSAFFFLNLFLHVALPLGMGLILWIHVSRIARPTLLPPKVLLWGSIALCTLIAVVWPLQMAPEADPFHLPSTAPADWWFGFWLPVTARVQEWFLWVVIVVVVALFLLAPKFSRPVPGDRAPSAVDKQLCTECGQCVVDCPYEAITLVERDDDRPSLVAQVDPTRCVSCGICAGSCSPMGIGPPTRTGRNQLERTRAFMRTHETSSGKVVVLGCRYGAGAFSDRIVAAGADFQEMDCAGNLHSSVVEFLIRGGAGGVLVLSCPPRDCRNREGPGWSTQRLYHGREAELKPRVDRDYLRVAYAGAGDIREGLRALRDFQNHLAAMEPLEADPDLEIETLCEPVVLEEGRV